MVRGLTRGLMSLAIVTAFGAASLPSSSFGGPFGGSFGYYYRQYSPGHWVYRHTIGGASYQPSMNAAPGYGVSGYPASAYVPPAPVVPMADDLQQVPACQSIPRACCAKNAGANCSCAPAVSTVPQVAPAR